MDDKIRSAGEERMAANDDTFGFGSDGLQDWTPVGKDDVTIGEILEYPVADSTADAAGEPAVADVVAVSGLVDQGWSTVDDGFDFANILESMDEAAEAAESATIVGGDGTAGAGLEEPGSGYTVAVDPTVGPGTDFDPSLS